MIRALINGMYGLLVLRGRAHPAFIKDRAVAIGKSSGATVDNFQQLQGKLLIVCLKYRYRFTRRQEPTAYVELSVLNSHPGLAAQYCFGQ